MNVSEHTGHCVMSSAHTNAPTDAGLTQNLKPTQYNAHLAYPRTDDQAELAWLDWLNAKTLHPQMVTHNVTCSEFSTV